MQYTILATGWDSVLRFMRSLPTTRKGAWQCCLVPFAPVPTFNVWWEKYDPYEY
jgi:hypothetical protein